MAKAHAVAKAREAGFPGRLTGWNVAVAIVLVSLAILAIVAPRIAECLWQFLAGGY